MTFLYVNYLFDWKYSSFLKFALASIGMETFATAFILWFFSRRLAVSDHALGLTTCIFRVIAFCVTAFAKKPFMMYIGSAVNSAGFTPAIVLRSLITKTVAPNELGQVFAFISSLESILPLVSDPVYTLVYNATLQAFPGTVYLIGAASSFLMLLSFTWVPF